METQLIPSGKRRRAGQLSIALAALVALEVSVMTEDSLASPTPHSGRLRLEIQRLRSLGRVLYLAAHPDDENTRVLAWLAAERKVRTAYLSLTRGGGGQNLIGKERGVAVAMLRTQELAAARRVDGAEQFFSRARDFGYSKSAEETLRIWNKSEVLGDVVWILRRFRPDVVITRFAGDGSGRHGHHTASALLAKEAFALAADAKAYPQQLREGVSPWQVKRLLWNSYHWRPVPPSKLRGALAIDVGAYSASLGRSVAELAAASRTMHKSQGFGSAPRRGSRVERFKLLAGAPAKRDILEGVELSWGRVKGGGAVDRELAKALAVLAPDAPERAIAALSRAGKAMEHLADHRDKRAKLEDLAGVIAGCAGLVVEARAPHHELAPGDRSLIELQLLSRRPAGLKLTSIRWPDGKLQRVAATLPEGKLQRWRHQLRISARAPTSQPPWLAAPPAKGSYSWPANTAQRGKPGIPEPLAVELTLRTPTGHRITLRRPLERIWTDRVRGERRRKALVVPPVLITPARRVVVVPWGRRQTVRVTLRATRGKLQGVLRPTLPEGYRCSPRSAAFTLAKRGDERSFAFELRAPRRGKVGARRDELSFSAEVRNERYERGLLEVDYPHIDPMAAFPKATLRLVSVDLRLGGKRVAYLPGAGDELPEALAQIGYKVTSIAVSDLDARALRRYDALIFGIRAYNTHPELEHKRPALDSYVRGGGTLLVQYNTSSRWRPLKIPVGPWPLTINRGRITDETAPLTLLAPRHAAFRSPNRLGSADFDGWVQERGLYFAKRFDKRYTPLLAGKDPKERQLQRGALLVGKLGKGHFVYTGLSFFRQIPAGVPGAYRLLANLLAL